MKHNTELLIIKHPPEYSGIFEVDYAIDYCNKKLIKSLEELDLKYKMILMDEILEITNFSDKVLVISNDRLLVNSQLLNNLLNILDMGYDACGPGLNKTKLKEQIGIISFPLLSNSIFKEHSAYAFNEDYQIVESKNLDKSFFICTRNFFKGNKYEIIDDSVQSIKVQSPSESFAILKNDLAYIFSETYGTLRSDLIELIPDNATSVLEIGSAEGLTGKQFKELRSDTIIDAVELNEVMALESMPFYNEVFVCRFESFEASKKYDAVICGDVLEHMENPWLQINRIYNLLNSKGCVIISIPNAGHWSLVKDMINGTFDYLPIGITCITHLRWFTEESIKEALVDAGFVIEIFERQKYKPSSDGENFIDNMVRLGYSKKETLLTAGFIIKVVKK